MAAVFFRYSNSCHWIRNLLPKKDCQWHACEDDVTWLKKKMTRPLRSDSSLVGVVVFIIILSLRAFHKKSLVPTKRLISC